MEKKENLYTTIKILKVFAKEIDHFVHKSGRYRNRNEFCIEGIRIHLRKMEE